MRDSFAYVGGTLSCNFKNLFCETFEQYCNHFLSLTYILRMYVVIILDIGLSYTAKTNSGRCHNVQK